MMGAACFPVITPSRWAGNHAVELVHHGHRWSRQAKSIKMERKYTSMPSLPKLNTTVAQGDALPVDSALENTRQAPSTSLVDYFLEHVTFYRIHLAAFTFIPLVTSGIFYASNGRFHISYIDSLFICYSSMTVTGLSTINLSTLTPWQQVILYFLMIIVSQSLNGYIRALTVPLIG